MIILLAKLLLAIPLWIISDLVHIGRVLLIGLPVFGRMMARALIPGAHDTEWIACFTEYSFCQDPAFYIIGEDWDEYLSSFDRPEVTPALMRWLYYALVGGRLVFWSSMLVSGYFAGRICARKRASSKDKQP